MTEVAIKNGQSRDVTSRVMYNGRSGNEEDNLENGQSRDVTRVG